MSHNLSRQHVHRNRYCVHSWILARPAARGGPPTIALDERSYPQFGKNYWLKGSDNGAVLAFLSPAKIAFLENRKLPGTIATNSDYLVYFESGSLRTEQEYDTFIETVDQLAANML